MDSDELNRQVRQDILASAEQFFGKPVAFDERAFQAIEIVSRRGKTPSPAHLWTSLSKTLPAVWHLYDLLGFPAYDGLRNGDIEVALTDDISGTPTTTR